MEMAQVKKPKLKIPKSISFCDRARFKLPSAGKGTTKTITSVKMFPAALMYQNGKLGTHVPSTSGFQKFSIGVQVKVVTRSCEMDHKPTKARAPRMTLRPSHLLRAQDSAVL